MSNNFLPNPLNREPWVIIPSKNDLKGWNKNSEITFNQINRQTEKYKMFIKTFDFLTENEIHGDYFEFGCHRCRTFRMVLSLAYMHHIKDMNFYAFDSFEGLPELENSVSVKNWKKGSLTTSEKQFNDIIKKHGLLVDKVSTIKGFYKSSLNNKLKENFKKRKIKASLVTIDCDLYESAVPVFKFLDDFLQEGTIIYLDDLFVGNKGNPDKGVAKAFVEYKKKSRWSFSRHMDVSWWGRTYITNKKTVKNINQI